MTIPLLFFDPYMHAKRGIKDFRTTPYIITCACSSLTSSTEANCNSNDTGIRYDKLDCSVSWCMCCCCKPSGKQHNNV